MSARPPGSRTSGRRSRWKLRPRHRIDHAMKHSIILACTAAVLLSTSLSAKVYDREMDISGTTVHYKLVVPKDYDAEKTYPGILAFPPGSQTMDMVLSTLERNWAQEGVR